MNYAVHPGLFFIVVVMLALLGACSDAEFAKLTQLGEGQHVQCWSGDTVIFEGDSTGKVFSEQGSDGYFFEEAGTGRLLEVSGNCILSSMSE